jgi:hypothetical protein
MDSLLNLYGIASCIILAVSVPVLVLAVFLPKERRHEIVRMVGRWWMGL